MPTARIRDPETPSLSQAMGRGYKKIERCLGWHLSTPDPLCAHLILIGTTQFSIDIEP